MELNTTKLPFAVSARTARLIGRENVAQAESAVIELVKNSYDADATTCLVLFDNSYTQVPEVLSSREYLELSKESTLVKESYEQDAEGVYRRKIFTENSHQDLHLFFTKKCDLYIIDNGEGMDRSVLENYWMTIGTDNKLYDIKTPKSRIKVGAKGIGRFALDRLGGVAEMLTISKEKNQTHYWKVDWSQFDKPQAKLNEIYAELKELNGFDLSSIFSTTVSENIKKLFPVFMHGTILKISKPSDAWDKGSLDSLFTNLRSLTPPGNTEIFRLYMHSLVDDEYGLVNKDDFDDYDYKLNAEVNKDLKISISISRREFDGKKIPERFFLHKKIKDDKNMKQEYFLDGESFEISPSINELIPGLTEGGNSPFRNIGPFKFTIYFAKLTAQKENQEIFHYRTFNSQRRKEWLKQFGGVKIYRDNFIVRPYGKPNTLAFDWLEFGQRATSSPAGVSKSGEGFRLRPHQVAGTVSISRVDNPYFEDQANREGFQENSTFYAFKELLVSMVEILEKDRAKIGSILKSIYEDDHKIEKEREEGVKIAKEYLKKSSTGQNDMFDNPEAEEVATKASKAAVSLSEKIEDMQNELQMSRGLASTGLIITSLAHELEQISDTLIRRVDSLKSLLEPVVNNEAISKLPNHKNPWKLLKTMRDDDEQLMSWLRFALASTRSYQRKRRILELNEFFTQLKEDWSTALEKRAINLSVDVMSNSKIEIYPLQMYSIFNNLIINSIDAFKRPDSVDKREIYISCRKHLESNIEIEYGDSGPGLSKDIVNPNDIFEPFFTTKRDSLGKKIGVGLGMWIVQAAVEENKGEVEIIESRPHFKLRITLPVKEK